MLSPELSAETIIKLAILLESGFVAGALAMMAGNRRTDNTAKRNRWMKFRGYFLIVHAMVAIISSGGWVMLSILAVLISGASVELTLAIRHGGTGPQRLPVNVIGLLVFVLCCSGLTWFALASPATSVLFVYIVVAVLDAYSQLAGQIFGRHKLAPGISPNKTIEGAVGGFSMAILTAVLLRELAGCQISSAAALGVCIAFAGTCGDLAASAFKRFNGIKDYSSLLPGQGGIIDRFNSFFASCACCSLIRIPGLIN
jgi:phosphatidate cytidylyltransferase